MTVKQYLTQEEFITWRKQYRSEDLALILYRVIEAKERQEENHRSYRMEIENFYKRKIKRLNKKLKEKTK